MSNDSKRISELGITTTLANTDRVVVLTNPNTSAQTQTITLQNLANKLASNALPIANSSQLGIIKIGAGLSVAANGVVTAPLPLANTVAAGVVIVGSGINVNGNGVISVNALTNTSQLTNDSGFITANNAANTGRITFSNNIITIKVANDINILGNNAGVNMTSNDYVQMTYSENGSLYGTGSDNITLSYVSHAEIGTYIKHFDANVGIDAWTETISYGNGMFDHVGITNAYSFSWDIGPIDSVSLGITPSSAFINRLAITPTGDYDIHLWESGTNGAITLGNYGATNFRVYGSGGANGGGGQYGNDIRAELYGNASFTITSNNSNNVWRFDDTGVLTFPDTTVQTTAYTGVKAVSLVNTTSYNVNTTQEIILCDPNAAGNNITVTLPNTAANGKIFTVKNINDGGYDVYVEANGQPNIIELHGVGTFNTYDNISASGNVVSWVYYNGYYRVVSYG